MTLTSGGFTAPVGGAACLADRPAAPASGGVNPVHTACMPAGRPRERKVSDKVSEASGVARGTLPRLLTRLLA